LVTNTSLMPEGDNGQVQDANQNAVAAPTEQEIQNQIGMAMAFDDVSMMPKTDQGTSGAASTTEAGAESVTTTQTQPDYTPFIKETFGVETIEG
jgi:hypothetical protein